LPDACRPTKIIASIGQILHHKDASRGIVHA
jgi:hypothetical protein